MNGNRSGGHVTFEWLKDHVTKFICLFVTWYFVPLEKFSLISSLYQCWWKAANFDLCSALMAIEQWGFYCVPHLLWHGASVYNGHLRETRDTHTYCRAFSSGALTVCFYDRSRLGFKHPTFRLRGECSNTLRHRRGNVIKVDQPVGGKCLMSLKRLIRVIISKLKTVHKE